jgi:hypothetical protein
MDSLKKLFREEKRQTADVAKKIKTLKKSLREGERTEQDIEALKDIQKEFDYFIKKMIDDKLLLAGLEIGAMTLIMMNTRKKKLK